MIYKVIIIVGPTRPQNLGIHIAEWIKTTIEYVNQLESSFI
jgi:hypothetical protein